jgi:hypothetical protein
MPRFPNRRTALLCKVLALALGPLHASAGIFDNPPPDKRAEQAFEESKQTLARGGIPQDLREEHRIVDSTHNADARKWEEELQRIARKVLPRSRQGKPPRILLSDANEINALRVRYADPPLYILTRGALEKYGTEGLLSVLIAHEDTHQMLAENYGEGKNSKGEEMWAVLRPPSLMAEAGINPREVLDEIELLKKQRSARKNAPSAFDLFEVLDVHASLGQQERAAQYALSALKRQGKAPKVPATPIDTDLVRRAGGVRTQSFLESFLADAGFEKASRARRLEILTHFIDTNSHWNRARLGDLLAALAQLFPAEAPLSALDRGAMESLATAAGRVVSRAGITSEFEPAHVPEQLWSFVLQRSEGAIELIKPLASVHEGFSSFLHAQGPVESADAAATALRSLQELPVRPQWTREKGKLPLYPPQLTGPNPPKFVSQLAWNSKVLYTDPQEAKQNGLAPEQRSAILVLLTKMGVRDPRLLFSLDADGAIALTTHPESYADPMPPYSIDGGRIVASQPPASIFLAHQERRNELSYNFLAEYNPVRPLPEHNPFRPPLESHFQKLISLLALRAQRGDSKARDALLALKEREIAFPVDHLALYPDPLSLGLMEKYPHLVGEMAAILSTPIAGFLAHAKPSPELRKFLLAYLSKLGEKHSYYQFETAIPGILSVPDSVLTNTEKREIFSERTTPLNHRGAIAALSHFLGHPAPEDAGAVVSLASKIGPSASALDQLLLASLAQTFSLSNTQKADVKGWIPQPGPLWSFVVLGRGTDLEGRGALSEQVHRWGAMASSRAFPEDGISRFRWLKALLSRITHELPLASQAPLIDKLLYAGHIEDPNLRKQALEIWTAAHAHVLGEGTDKPEYLADLRRLLDRAQPLLAPADRLEAFGALGDAIVSQRAASNLLESRLHDVSRASLEQTYIHGVLGEAAIGQLAKTPELRSQLLHMLLEPESETERAKLATDIARRIHYEEFLIDGDRFHPFEGGGTKQEFMERKRRRFKALENATDRGLSWLYKNYREATLDHQAIILDQLLAPPDGEKFERPLQSPRYSVNPAHAAPPLPRTTLEIIDFVLDRQKGKTSVPLSPERLAQAKEVLIALAQTEEPFARGLFHAQLMASTQRSAGTQGAAEKTLGDWLADFLTGHSPAGNRMAQELDSYPGLAPDLKSKKLRASKTHANLRPRWELWKMVDAHLPADAIERLEWLGPVLGTGTDWIVTQSKVQEAGKTADRALALQRLGVQPRTQDGYEHFRAAANTLASTPFQKSILARIKRAEEASRVGLDPKVAERQYANAVEAFDGLEVEVDGFRLKFQVAKWHERGERFRFMDMANGHHLDKLTGSDAYRKAWAKAIALVNLVSILGGGVFNDDWHVGQGEIHEAQNTMVLYDWGGMGITPPSSEERLRLGKLLAEALQGSKLTGEAAERVGRLLEAELVAEIGGGREPSPYLLRVHRALNGLQDALKYLDGTEINHLLGSIQAQGLIHKEIAHFHKKVVLAATVRKVLKGNISALGQFLPQRCDWARLHKPKR